MTSFDTTEADIDEFAATVRRVLALTRLRIGCRRAEMADPRVGSPARPASRGDEVRGVPPASTATTPSHATCAMRVRVATDAEPMCGRSTARGAASSFGCTSGSRSNTSIPAAKIVPSIERVGERLLVDDRTARRVHEHRVRPHRGQLGAADQPAGRVGERDVDRHDVGVGEQPVEVADVPGLAGVGAGVVQDAHAEAGGPPGHRPPDAAVADEAERGAVHVAAEVLVDAPAVPAVLAQVGLGVVREARRREHQEEREVGGGLVEHAGRVAHRDPAPVRGGDVDVVVADRDVRDDAQPVRRRPRARRRRCGR